MNDLQTSFPEWYNGPAKRTWFTKLEAWENELRILDWKVEIGYEYFTNENKPVRQKEEFDWIPSDSKIWQNWKPQFPKEVWVMKVYNYKTKEVEIWAVTQNSIKDYLWVTAHNKKLWWLWAIDLTISRTWSGLDTKYAITPIKTDLTDEIKEANKKSDVNLSTYFDKKEDKIKNDWFPDEAFPATALVSE